MFHSKYRLRLERTQEHSSVKYSGCQIFHLGARLTFDSHRFNLCKCFSNLIKASNITQSCVFFHIKQLFNYKLNKLTGHFVSGGSNEHFFLITTSEH